MTSQGSPYARLRRALDRRNLVSAASDLPHVGLMEALELVLLVCDRAPEKYDRAALRWSVRYARETQGVTLGDAQALLALLAVLPERREQAAHALSNLLIAAGSSERVRR